VAPGAAVEWAGNPLLWVIREHYEIVKRVVEEGEHRSSAVILVDVSRSGLISSGEERKGHYADPEESRRWVGSVGWRGGQWGMGGCGSFRGGC
jgi:hypothetical protein